MSVTMTRVSGKGSRLYLALLLVFSISLFSHYSLTKHVYGQREMNTATLYEYMKLMDFENIRRHVYFFSSLNTRVVGTEGFYKAAEYVANEFSKYGLEPGPDGYYHFYNHSATVENTAELSVIDNPTISIRLLTVWPNLVLTSKTPPGGIEGELLYVGGNGDLEDFDGKDVAGKIVVMSYGTGSNWLNAAKLGAKAVIFLPSSAPVAESSLSKFTTTPLYFPRYYAPDNASLLGELARKGSAVRIMSNMHWEIIRGINILGIVEGRRKDEIIIVSSHFDSWTAVPGLAPGADESCGISTLLEMARVMAELAKEGHSPERTVWFVALSGHWQQLDGARNFVMDYLFDGRSGRDWPYTTPSQYRVYAWIGLDLSTGSNTLGILFFSYMYRPLNLMGIYSGRGSALVQLLRAEQQKNLKSILNAMASVSPEYSNYRVLFGDDDIGKSTPTTGFYYSSGGEVQGGISYVPYRDYLESEPAMIAGTPALTLRTVCDYRSTWWTLRDTFEKVDFNNLRPQALFAFGMIWIILNVDSLGIDYETYATPREHYTVAGTYTGPGMSALRGSLQVYNEFTDRFTDYQPNGTGLVVVVNQPFDPRSYIITVVDRGGKFLIKGLGSPSLYYGYAGMAGPSYQFNAFVIDNVTGKINLVSMSGVHTAGLFVMGGLSFVGVPAVYRAGEPFKIPVYKPAIITIFDAFSPYLLSPSYVDPVTGDPKDPVIDATSVVISSPTRFYPGLASISPPINPLTGAEHESYWSWENPYSSVWVEYVTPNVKVGLRLQSTQWGVRLGLLTNSSELNLEGVGFTLKEGEELRLSALNIASDLFAMNEARIKRLEPYGILDPNILNLHQLSNQLLEEARISLQNKQYSKYQTLIYRVWMMEVNVYNNLLSIIYDVGFVTVFFAALLLPFAYFLGRMLYSGTGIKAVAVTILIFCLAYIAFSILHPGMSITSSPTTIVLGFAVVILLLPIFAIFSGELSVALGELRKKLVGAHEEEVSRVSQAFLSISMGIGNLKKRSFRTILTSITLIIFTASLTSLASMTTLRIIQYTPLPGPVVEGRNIPPVALYDGIQIKQIGFNALSKELLNVVKEAMGPGALVDYQVWYYPNFFTSISDERTFIVLSSNGTASYVFNAFLGLSSERLLKLYGIYAFIRGGLLTAGSGQTGSGIPEVIPVLIPKTAARKLNYDLGDSFTAFGLRFIVTGVFDDESLNNARTLVDLDQDIPTPIDLLMPMVGLEQLAALGSPSRLKKTDWDKIMILPVDVAANLGGEIRVMTVTFKNESDFEKAVSTENENTLGRLVDVYNLEVVIGRKGEGVSLMSRRNQITISGLNLFIVPLIMMMLAVFNTLLTNIYERTREVKILSAVGVSPSSVTFMFIAEAMTFAFVSSFTGYIIGIGLIKLFSSIPGFLQAGFTPNYSAGIVVVAIALLMMATLIASVYPALKAGTLVTPSLERKWKIPTKPLGGTWEIPLPFSASGPEEALAVLRFVKEYLDANALERAGTMFATKSSELQKISDKEWVLKSFVSLAPFETGMAQTAELRVSPDEQGRIMFTLRLEHKGGPLERWFTSAREYAGLIRKQLLLWRGLVPGERAKYFVKPQEV
jgi:ABC-type antimicrobial peptide transport system permease subunit